MRFPKSALALCLVGIVLTAASSSERDERAPCRRPTARRIVEGEIILLKETRDLPCVLRFVPTGVVLRTDARCMKARQCMRCVFSDSITAPTGDHS